MATNPRQGEHSPGRTRGRVLTYIAAAAAAALLCAAAGAGTAQAQSAAARPDHAAGVAAPRAHHRALPAGLHTFKVNLHRQYLADLHHLKLGRISGILHPRGWHHAAAARSHTAGCTEPACDVTYGGGPVQHNPRVFLVLWGPDWSPVTDPSQWASALDMISLYASLGTAGQDSWSPITAQYGDGSGFPAFTGEVLTGIEQDTSTPPTGVTKAQLGAEAAASAAYFTSQGDTINTDSQIVIATQSGTCPQGFAAPGVCPGSPAPYCAWHSAFSNGLYANVPFTNLPYILDAGTFCYEDAVNPGSTGTYDGFTIVAGHEYAESVTDPVPLTGWSDPGDSISGGEVADKCTPAFSAAGNVTLAGHTFAMQKLWSNAAGGCVMAATEDTVTVTSPGTQNTGINGSVSLQLAGTSSGSNPLQWTATGLPPGLSISGSGLITGTATTAGAYTSWVYASDGTGATGWASFTWNVAADTVSVTNPGNQTSYAQATVKLQLSGSSSAGLTPLTWGGTIPAGITINTSTGLLGGAPYNAGTATVTATATDTGGVTGSASFTWTIKADVGKQLKQTSAKMCLNDKNSTATVGNAVNVWHCKPAGSIVGLGAQDWSFSSGQLKVFGLCLSDPGNGGTGTKLVLASCQGATSEVWTHQANGEYVLKLNGLCLTDPNDSTTNGTLVTITACQASTSQQWALP
jgi:Ricin-type beta-trefoil lectin domain/Putative Ig domain